MDDDGIPGVCESTADGIGEPAPGNERAHSPTPWRVELDEYCGIVRDADGNVVATTPLPADARVVVEAVNAHQPGGRWLSAAELATVREALAGLIDAVNRDANERGISGYSGARKSDADAALALLREVKP